MPLDEATRAFVLKWITEGRTYEILTLLDTMKDQRDRAELERDAYLHQIHELSKRAKAILEPLLKGEPKPATRTKSKPPTDMDFEIKL